MLSSGFRLMEDDDTKTKIESVNTIQCERMTLYPCATRLRLSLPSAYEKGEQGRFQAR
jgi:hypothetical protein